MPRQRHTPRGERQPAAHRCGAKSRGPITPEGKRNSATNSRRHGILSRSVVLPSENRQDFLNLLASLQETFQPAGEAALALVETMAVAHWRQQRMWAMETSGFQDEIEKHPADLRPSLRAAKAFRSLADQSNTLRLIDRYETRFYRQFTRSLRLLLQMSAPDSPPGPTAPPAPAQIPETENYQTNPATDSNQTETAPNERGEAASFPVRREPHTPRDAAHRTPPAAQPRTPRAALAAHAPVPASSPVRREPRTPRDAAHRTPPGGAAPDAPRERSEAHAPLPNGEHGLHYGFPPCK